MNNGMEFLCVCDGRMVPETLYAILETPSKLSHPGRFVLYIIAAFLMKWVACLKFAC